MQQIHSLPQPQQGGYHWEELEEARAVYNRIRQKAREIELERRELDGEISQRKARDEARLGRSWLEGEDGESEDPEIRALEAKKRSVERRERALVNTSIPEAEAQVAQVIGMNRLVWQEELWEDLPERAAETRAALGEAAASIQQAMHRLATTLSLIEWTNSNNPLAYSPPSGADRAVGEALERLYGYVEHIERRIAERNGANELEQVR